MNGWTGRARRRADRGVTFAAALVAIAVTLSACAGGGTTGTQTSGPPASPRPASTAVLAILAPTNGATVGGPSVHLRFSLRGARIVPATTTHIVPDEGHLHVYLDGQIAGMNFGLTDTLTGVSPGQHVLRVEFVASDHAPFNPRVFKEIVFEVKG